MNELNKYCINNKDNVCCYRAEEPQWGKYICHKCGAMNCQLHVSLWTDNMFHCFHCFAPTECLKKPNGLLCEKNIKYADFKRRALLVIDGLYIAGAQRHCLELINMLSLQGIAFTVVAVEGGGQWVSNFLEIAENVIIDFDGTLKWDTLRNSIEFTDFEFVTAHLKKGIEWTAKYIPKNIPRYAHFHSEPSEHEVITQDWIYQYCIDYDYMLFPSKSVLQCYAESFKFYIENESIGKKFKVMPNSIPCYWGGACGAKEVVLEETKDLKLAIVSRIDEDKFSIPMFINTMHNLNQLYPNIQVLVAGDGESMENLKKELIVSSVYNKVKLLGFVHDVHRIYEWADVVFLPSKREGMPYVMLECLASLCPIVVPKIGVFDEIESNGLVFIHKPNDAFEAALFIYKAFHMKLKRSDVVDKEAINKLFSSKSWENIVKEVYKV